ncbi:hypothetical protein ABZ726_18255 [Streptomyces hundungensis]|uniref:hypothetical protein n=1 Tax=Streptomyces hundungensis TaxID=1077946 RepID=UPI0033DC7251
MSTQDNAKSGATPARTDTSKRALSMALSLTAISLAILAHGLMIIIAAQIITASH